MTFVPTFSVQTGSPVTAVELPPLKVRPRPFQACVAPQFGEELHHGGLAWSWSRLSSHGPFALSISSVPDSLHLTGGGGGRVMRHLGFVKASSLR